MADPPPSSDAGTPGAADPAAMDVSMSSDLAAPSADEHVVPSAEGKPNKQKSAGNVKSDSDSAAQANSIEQNAAVDTALLGVKSGTDTAKHQSAEQGASAVATAKKSIMSVSAGEDSVTAAAAASVGSTPAQPGMEPDAPAAAATAGQTTNTDQVVPEPAAEAAASAQRLEILGMLLTSQCGDAPITPAPARLALPLPADGFMCDQCGDRFVLPSSLAQHQARRSLQATFDCPPCGRTLSFDNKCQLLEHLDSHQIDPVSLDPALIDAFALTPQQLGVTAPPPPTQQSCEPEQPDGDGPQPKRQKVHTVYRPVRVSCPMCNVLCSTHTLPDHFSPRMEPGTVLSQVLSCPHCSQPCPTQCSLMAHVSLHKDMYPYPFVCPECGMKILGTLDEAEAHVQGACLHSTRQLESRCALCKPAGSVMVADIHAHLVDQHVQKFYKCRLCPLAFESLEKVTAHLREKHADDAHQLADEEEPYMLILKCPFCAATFNSAASLQTHVTSSRHADQTLQLHSFVFRCPECTSTFDEKKPLRAHLAAEHPQCDITELRRIQPQGALVPGRANPARIGRPPKNAHALRDDTTGTSAEKPDPGDKPVITCTVCKKGFKRRGNWIEHGRGHLRSGFALCLLCNTRFSSTQALKNHLVEHAAEDAAEERCNICFCKMVGHEALQYHLEGEHNLRDYVCVRCDCTFDNLTALNHHNNTLHTGRPRTRGRGSRFPPRAPAAGRGAAVTIVPGSAQTIALKKEVVDVPATAARPRGGGAAPARRGRGGARRPAALDIPDPYQLQELPSERDTELSPPPMPDGAVYACFECDFTSVDRDALAWHVQTEHVDVHEPADGEEEEEDEPSEVIELEMKAGEIMRKQPTVAGQLLDDEEALSGQLFIAPDLDGYGVPQDAM